MPLLASRKLIVWRGATTTLLALGLVGLGACSTNDPTRPNDWELVSATGMAFTSPAEVMAQVGCTPLVGEPGRGTVGIRTPGGGYLQFDCPDPRQDSVRMALGTILGLFRDGTFPPSMQENPGGEAPPALEPGEGNGYWYYIFLGTLEVCTYHEIGLWTVDYFGNKVFIGKWRHNDNCYFHDLWVAAWITNPNDPLPFDPEELAAEHELLLTPPPVPVSVTVTAPSDTLYVGSVATTFSALVTYSDASTASPAMTWSSSNSSIIQSVGEGTAVPVGVGTASISALVPGTEVIASKTVVVVLPACGSEHDPNVADLENGQYADFPCSVPPEFATICPSCAFWKASAWSISRVGCRVTWQQPECTAWYDRIAGGDTTTLELTSSQFSRILTSLTADTMFTVQLNGTPLPQVGHATVVGDSVPNPTLNGTTYAYRRDVSFYGTSWGWILGLATLYYNAQGEPVAFGDVYNWNKDDNGSFVREGVVTVLKNATNNRSFSIKYP